MQMISTAVERASSAAAPLRHTDADHGVSERTRARILEAVPDNTRRAYARQWDRFEQWCAQHGRCPLPATAETLAEYVGELVDADLAPATVQQAVAAIRTAHRSAGHDGQPDTRGARMVLRGHRRARAAAGRRARQAPPVTIESLRAMVEVCDPATVKGLRDRVVLVLGLALMGRRSELAGLHIDDVTETADGLELLIRSSKTDQDAEGAVVAVPHGQHPDTDPVRLVREWLARLASHGVTSGRLLRSVTRHGRIGASLSGDAIADVVAGAAKRAQLPDAGRYSAHSLRAGGATSAYKAGAPVSVIAAHGRWSPGSSVVLSYVRAVDRWRDNALKGIGL